LQTQKMVNFTRGMKPKRRGKRLNNVSPRGNLNNGSSVTYSEGGQGGRELAQGQGGSSATANGGANTGGGGGGGRNGGDGGAGGSGIVIVRWRV